MKEITACFSGPRPHKLPFAEGSPRYCEMLDKLKLAIEESVRRGYTVFISGMAMGFDICAAESVLALRDGGIAVRLICAVPFKGQERGYDELYRRRYNDILRRADETVTVCSTYSSSSYRLRNEYMADRSSLLICFCDGRAGGTLNTVRYAEHTGVEIMNIFNEEYN